MQCDVWLPLKMMITWGNAYAGVKKVYKRTQDVSSFLTREKFIEKNKIWKEIDQKVDCSDYG